jgi:predicted HicB family RNase H-like nuclease
MFKPVVPISDRCNIKISKQAHSQAKEMAEQQNISLVVLISQIIAREYNEFQKSGDSAA